MSAFGEGIKEILAGPQGAELLEGATVRFPPMTVDLFDRTGRLLWRGPLELLTVPLEKDIADALEFRIRLAWKLGTHV